MALDGKVLSQARERLRERRTANEELRQRREREVYAKNPEIRRMDMELRQLVAEVVRAVAAPNAAEALAEVERKTGELFRRRGDALAAQGKPADWLDEIVTCPVCRDSGYLRSGEICTCLKKLYEEEKGRVAADTLQIGDEQFSDFRLDYYKGTDREYMSLALDVSKSYAMNFGADSPNLLFQGNTGLGKTFLARCVASVVSKRGFFVVYETAQGAFSAFEAQRYSRDGTVYAEADEKVRRILDCDLLVLDDLGTEINTNFTQSVLYNILNARIADRRKKTIVTTSLKDVELEKMYMPQIVSRLQGEFDLLRFMGQDIRAQRKQQRYSPSGGQRNNIPGTSNAKNNTATPFRRETKT